MIVVIPFYNINLLPPQSMEIDTPGASIEAPRSASGITSGIDFSGGGLWTVTFRAIGIFSRESHLHYNRLRAHLTGGTRAIVIPLLTDPLLPTSNANGDPFKDGITHTDGSLHSDGAGYAEPEVVARLEEAAAANASTVSIRTQRGTFMEGGEIFSLFHTNKGWRCYQVGQVDTQLTINGNTVTTCEIRPPLREAATVSTEMRFVRPLLTVRLAPGATMPWAPSGWWEALPDVSFIEAF